MCMQMRMKREMPKTANNSAAFHDSMAMAPRRSPSGARAAAGRRRRRNARSPLVAGSATARALAAGLWRLRHAAAPYQPSPRHGRRGSTCCNCNGHRIPGAPRHCRNHGILEKIEACVEVAPNVWMEKATKWERNSNTLDGVMGLRLGLGSATPRADAHAMAAALAQVAALEDEKRETRKKVERWVAEGREKMAALREQVRMERRHRRQLEAANARLMRSAAEAKAAARQAAQSCETERKARALMEEACEELTREVEEVAALREEMEEERRMLQMAEVWREERVQMKLSDARAALDHKFSQLDRLQSQMEDFLRKAGGGGGGGSGSAALRMMSEAASFARAHDVKELMTSQHQRDSGSAGASPATDIFLEKLGSSSNDDGSADLSGWAWDRNKSGDSSASCSDPPSVAANGSGVNDAEAHPRRPAPGKNTALLRRLWRSAISDSRKKAGTGTPPSEHSHSRPAVVAEPVKLQRIRQPNKGGKHKQSLKEKLMEARMDDHTSSRP